MPRTVRPLATRFWVKVSIPLLADGTPDRAACWLWTGAKCGGRPAGGEPYGTIREGPPTHRMRKAHVVSWFLKTGQWSVEDVCHKCDTPLCCNPDHLFEASHRENMKDYILKYGRVAVEKRPLPPRPQLPYVVDEDETYAPADGVLEEPPF